jgi:hypothetical protein
MEEEGAGKGGGGQSTDQIVVLCGRDTYECVSLPLPPTPPPSRSFIRCLSVFVVFSVCLCVCVCPRARALGGVRSVGGPLWRPESVCRVMYGPGVFNIFIILLGGGGEG